MRKNRRQADPMGVLKRPDKRSSLATGNSNIPEGFHTINFDSEKYLESYFSDNSVLTAAQHRKLLAKSKLNIAGTLKKIAYDYYDKFVDTADSMQYLDSDMSNIYKILVDYKNVLKSTQEVEFDFEGTVQVPGPTLEAVTFSPDLIQESIHERLVDEMNEEMQLFIFERQFDQAIGLLHSLREKARELELDMSLIEASFDTHRCALVDILLLEINNSSLPRSERVKLCSGLVTLGMPVEAMKLLSDIRTSKILSDIKCIVSHGDTVAYIKEVTSIFTTSILEAQVGHLAVFKAISPGFMLWAKQEINSLADIFIEHVFSPTNALSLETIGECLNVLFTSCIDTLESRGFRLSFILQSRLKPQLAESIFLRNEENKAEIEKALTAEKWESSSVVVANRSEPLTLTRSAKTLYQVCERLLHDLIPTISLEKWPDLSNSMYMLVSHSLMNRIEKYAAILIKCSQASGISPSQLQALSQNCSHISNDLVDRVRSSLSTLFERRGPEFEKFSARIDNRLRALVK